MVPMKPPDLSFPTSPYPRITVKCLLWCSKLESQEKRERLRAHVASYACVFFWLVEGSSRFKA